MDVNWFMVIYIYIWLYVYIYTYIHNYTIYIYYIAGWAFHRNIDYPTRI